MLSPPYSGALVSSLLDEAQSVFRS